MPDNLMTPDVHDLADTILKAADETLDFNQFADQHDLAHRDLVSFYS